MKTVQWTWSQVIIGGIGIGLCLGMIVNGFRYLTQTEHLKCGRIVGLSVNYATLEKSTEYFITTQGVNSHGATLKETYQVDQNTYRAFEKAEYFCPGMID